MRVGIGYDIHRLIEGRRLVLGGVEIPYVKGLIGYSDADVVLHAVSDAVLGAAGLGDIGEHFPDTDPEFKDCSSIMLLNKVRAMADKKGYAAENADIVVVAEEPRIARFREEMKKNIAGALKINPYAVNVKASTGEGVGSIGRGEAIASYAVVMLKKK